MASFSLDGICLPGPAGRNHAGGIPGLPLGGYHGRPAPVYRGPPVHLHPDQLFLVVLKDAPSLLINATRLLLRIRRSCNALAGHAAGSSMPGSVFRFCGTHVLQGIARRAVCTSRVALHREHGQPSPEGERGLQLQSRPERPPDVILKCLPRGSHAVPGFVPGSSREPSRGTGLPVVPAGVNRGPGC